MTTFALVHGAWHGAWCWERLIDELDKRGHRSVAVELPCEDPSAGAREYAAVVLDALEGEDEALVLVGHSLGGVTVPLVAQARPVRSLVYLTPSLPKLGSSVVESMAEEPVNTAEVLAELEVVDGTFLRVAPEQAALFFNACAPDDAAWATKKLRLQALTPLTETTPLGRFPDVPSTVILGTDDRLLNVPMMQKIARRRLGVEPIVIASDHSPFLSMPAALADLLTSV
jgi:pimeloyl-ACP methyl ester carboxylesterase